jgi:hypothetical protein
MSQLVVDPITKATKIFTAAPDTNYGTDVTLAVIYTAASYKTAANVGRTLADVDISAIPAGSTIASTSKAELYCGTVLAAVAATLYRITQPAWTELGATWNKYDGTNPWAVAGGDYGDPHVHFTTPAATGWFTITGDDFAAFLQDALNNCSGIVRMLMRLDVESLTTTSGAYFASDDDTHDPSWKLKLTVDYTEGGAAYVESYGCMF